MKTIKLLTFLLIGSVFIFIVLSAIWNAYNPPQYGFFDISIKEQIHNIVLDGKGRYHIRFWRSSQAAITIEEGTYSDPGGDEIILRPDNGHTYQVKISNDEVILTPKNVHTYKIKVWDRNTKDPQYRFKT